MELDYFPSFSWQKSHSRGMKANSSVGLHEKLKSLVVCGRYYKSKETSKQNEERMSLSLPHFYQENSPKDGKGSLQTHHSHLHYHELLVE